jgi:DNA-binding XRE family transcriptional regulator
MKGQKTQAELASMYNIRRQTVGEILRGEIWKTGQYSPYVFNAELATAAARARWAK